MKRTDSGHVFRTVMLDPPWLERGGGKVKRGADRHYELLKTKDMPQVILQSGVWRLAENAHVYMWATNNYLPDAFWLLDCLNLQYKTIITWPKKRAGLGQYFRGRTEHLLFAIRGKGKDPSVYRDRRDLTTLLEVPDAPGQRIHSRKPDAAFDFVETRSRGPYLEMFSDLECLRPGWVRWGLPRRQKVFGQLNPSRKLEFP